MSRHTRSRPDGDLLQGLPNGPLPSRPSNNNRDLQPSVDPQEPEDIPQDVTHVANILELEEKTDLLINHHQKIVDHVKNLSLRLDEGLSNANNTLTVQQELLARLRANEKRMEELHSLLHHRQAGHPFAEQSDSDGDSIPEFTPIPNSQRTKVRRQRPPPQKSRSRPHADQLTANELPWTHRVPFSTADAWTPPKIGREEREAAFWENCDYDKVHKSRSIQKGTAQKLGYNTPWALWQKEAHLDWETHGPAKNIFYVAPPSEDREQWPVRYVELNALALNYIHKSVDYDFFPFVQNLYSAYEAMQALEALCTSYRDHTASELASELYSLKFDESKGYLKAHVTKILELNQKLINHPGAQALSLESLRNQLLTSIKNGNIGHRLRAEIAAISRDRSLTLYKAIAELRQLKCWSQVNRDRNGGSNGQHRRQRELRFNNFQPRQPSKKQRTANDFGPSTPAFSAGDQRAGANSSFETAGLSKVNCPHCGRFGFHGNMPDTCLSLKRNRGAHANSSLPSSKRSKAAIVTLATQLAQEALNEQRRDENDNSTADVVDHDNSTSGGHTPAAHLATGMDERDDFNDFNDDESSTEVDNSHDDYENVVILNAHAVHNPSIENKFPSSMPAKNWNIDSAAGRHVTGLRKLLSDFRKWRSGDPRFIVTAGGHYCKVLGVGNAIIKTALPSGTIASPSLLYCGDTNRQSGTHSGNTRTCHTRSVRSSLYIQGDHHI